ncbi:hypothetical protein TorRG33x02_328520 [Trema orientale]|uniref:Uncharacterized protein n=1 Tax=Trema orientale TaxID=63057 RepID=A0A2P5B9S5_TREOI|nr:hypothetical protein TorRG33x02_328520 [Trema orientale]
MRNGRRRYNISATIFDESPPSEYRNLYTVVRLGLVGHLNVVRPFAGVETLLILVAQEYNGELRERELREQVERKRCKIRQQETTVAQNYSNEKPQRHEIKRQKIIPMRDDDGTRSSHARLRWRDCELLW